MKMLLAFALAATLSSCAVLNPVLDVYDTTRPSGGSAPHATIWANNSDISFAMIEKVDGKTMPSRRLAGYPYSVAVTPGKHRLAFLVWDKTMGQIAHFEQQIEVEAGHAYALSFRNSADGANIGVPPRLIDLGLGKRCKYEVTGTMRGGHQPVALRCV